MKKLEEIISQKKWNLLIASYSPEEICRSLNFNQTMQLTNRLFHDDFSNDDNQQFSLKLAYEAKNHFKEDWEKDWKNDVFLGDLSALLCLYDEQYEFYKRAYDKLTDPPAKLLLLLASCNTVPGIPPVSEEEAEAYLRKSIEKKVTFESALMMRTLSERKGDKLEADYWNRLYKELEAQGVVEILVPDALKEDHLKRLISRKEWSFIISNFSPEDICQALCFNEAVQMAEHLFCDDITRDDSQEYALNLAFEIRDFFEGEGESLNI